MQTKRSIWVILLCWLVFTSACQHTSSAPVVPITNTAVVPSLAAAMPQTATPQALENSPLIPINIIRAGTPPKRGEGKVLLPEIPGDYLIYRTKLGLMQYVSLDGSLRGNLIDGYLINEIEPVLEIDGLDPVRMISNGKDSRFIFVQEWDDEHYAFKSASIWMTDIFGNPILSWEIPLNSNLLCLKPAFSPQSRWILIDCKVGRVDAGFYSDNHQLHLIDIKSGMIKIFNVTKCYGGEVFHQQIIWSKDEEQFLYWCNYNEYALISIENAQPSFVQILTNGSDIEARHSYILSISPDWKKVVLDMGSTPKNADGTVSGYRIYVVDFECVLKNPKCADGEIFTLSFPEPRSEPSRYTDLHIYWDMGWGDIAWAVFPRGASSGAAGCIDLSTNTNQKCDWDFVGHEYFGVSPDGEWLVLAGTKDWRHFPRTLYVVSVKDGTVRHLVEPDPNNAIDYIGFYGWLTIP